MVDELVRAGHVRVHRRLFRRARTARAATCGSGRRGCSSSSSPIRATTPALRRRGRRDRARAARAISTPRSRAAARPPSGRGRRARPLPGAAGGRASPASPTTEIRTALMGLIVGGPPQPPMVVPQAMEQLLRRPEALAGAQAAARAATTRCSPAMCSRRCASTRSPRRCRGSRSRTRPSPPGRARERTVPKGATVLAAFSSAMMDERRVPDPRRLRPAPAAARIHPFRPRPAHLLRHPHQPGDAAADAEAAAEAAGPAARRGPDGRLSKRGAFADRLIVEYDQH